MRVTDVLPLGAVALIVAFGLLLVGGRGLRLFFARFFLVWYALVAATLLFKLGTIGFVEGSAGWALRANFVPFRTIMLFVRAGDWMQIIGNAAVFLPLPVLLCANFPKARLSRCAAASLVLAALIEPVQFFVNVALRAPYNIIDVDDFILNIVGVLAGLVVAGAVFGRRCRR